MPYLYGYFHLKKHDYPTMKLLIVDPSIQKLYKFNTETFELLHISSDDFVYHSHQTLYEKLFVSTSLTYGKSYDMNCMANIRYTEESMTVWNKLGVLPLHESKFPKKFYVSRRTYIHNDTSNLGTNYTTRRKCMNEDALVELLTSYKIPEVFCEQYSMEEKIRLFSNAELVIGFIGGGLTNLLFSPSTTRVLCINTPEFATINKRFLHSINHTDYELCDITSLAPHALEIPLYVRVRLKDSDIVGEIDDYTTNGRYIVKVPTNIVAGFALDTRFPTIEVSRYMFEPLDKGLNSPFVCRLDELEAYVRSTSSVQQTIQSPNLQTIQHIV